MRQRIKAAGSIGFFLILAYFTVIRGRGPSSPSRWGYIDRSGAVRIEPRFSAAGEFSEGLAAVRVDEKWGYVNTQGEFVIPPRFARANKFSDGLAAVSMSFQDREWEAQFGYIDKTGAVVIPVRFNWTGSFSEGLAPVCEGSCGGAAGSQKRKIGYIDRSGGYVIQPDFAMGGPFSEGFATVTLDREGPYRYGYINKAGAFSLQPKWWATGPFRQGLAATYSGYIDRQGQLKIPVPEIPGGHVYDFSDGLGLVQVSDESTYYDATGNIALKTNRTYPFVDGLAAAHDRGWFGSPHWGYIDKTGKVAIEFQWDMAEQFSEKLAAVCLGCRPFD